MNDNSINLHIKNVQNGNLNSFRFLIDQYKRMAMSLAMSILKNREQAEDTVQDAFVSAYNNINKYDFSYNFSTWFYKIVMNQSLMLLRKQKADLILEIDTSELEEIPDEKFDLLSDKDIAKLINDTISCLPYIDSAVLTMYYYDDINLEEIAKIMDLKYSNAKVILHRARLKLKKELLANYSDELKDWL